MAKEYKTLVFLLISVWLLVSCAQNTQSVESVASISASAEKNNRTPILPRSTLTTPYIEASETMPANISIINNPNQFTDGTLNLMVNPVHGRCYQAGEQMFLFFTFENLTDRTLIIADYNLISSHVVKGSYGRLIPVLTSIQNIRLMSREDSMLISVFNSNPTLTKTLPPKNKFNVSNKYTIPTEVVTADQFDSQFQPLPGGQYFLRFIYIAYKFEDSWEGMISSNQIEFCLISK